MVTRPCDFHDFEDVVETAIWLNKHHPPAYNFRTIEPKTCKVNQSLTDRIPGAFRPSYTPTGLWQYSKVNKGKEVTTVLYLIFLSFMVP